MVTDPTKWGSTAALVFGFLAIALVAVAAQVIPPNVSDSNDGGQRPVIVAPEVLDRYVGFYVRGGHTVITVTRDGPHLAGQPPGYAPLQLVAESETEFKHKNTLWWTFVRDSQGQATGLVEHLGNVASYFMPRIDATVARQIMADNHAKRRSATPTPGSEAALRRMIDGIRAGKPNYDQMAPWFANLVRQTLYLYAPVYADWGAVQSVTFRHVDMNGADVYEVRQERGISSWSIFMNSSGLIADADNVRGSGLR